MKLTEFRKLIREEVRKVVKESRRPLKEAETPFTEDLAQAMFKYAATFLPADYANVYDRNKSGFKYDVAIRRPSKNKLSKAMIDILLLYNIDSVEKLYKAGNVKYTGKETIEDYLNGLEVDEFRNGAGIELIPGVVMYTEDNE